jgi:hypothetical protein
MGMTGQGDDGLSPRRLNLPGGRRLTIRPSTSADADALTQMFTSLEDDDLYRRFFQAHLPTAKTIEHILSAAERDGVGLVATLEERHGGVRIVGETSYELLPDGAGEIGITVAPGSRGWLGPYLLDVLVDAARARGVTNLQADVLVENRRMLAMMRTRGYATMDHSERPSIVRVVIGTLGRTPPWPGTHEATRVLVEAPGGRWHSESAARAAGFEVLVCPGPLTNGRCPAMTGEPCPLASAADLVVDAVSPDTPAGRVLLDAHERLHAGVPLCVELPSGARTTRGRSELPPYTDDTTVVALLQRLTRPPASA